MSGFTRKCPICDKDITSKNKYYSTFAGKQKTPCASCAAKKHCAGVENPSFVDISGEKFSYLTAIRPIQTKTSQTGNSSGFYWEFRCECGKVVTKHASSVRRGVLTSCGCRAYENYLGNKHGLWKGFGEIPKTYFLTVKRGARVRRGKKVDFLLTIEYMWQLFLKQERKCALTGELLIFCSAMQKKRNQNGQTASLDRIDSSKGYVEGNVQWVHKDVNKMKQDFSEERFLSICKKIADYKKK